MNMSIHWAYTLSHTDPFTGIEIREVFMFPDDAAARRRRLLEEGFSVSRVEQRRVGSHGHTDAYRATRHDPRQRGA